MIIAILKTSKADLNIHYKKYFQIRIIIVLVLLIAAFKFSPDTSLPVPIKIDKYDWIDVEKINNTTRITRPPIPPKPQIPKVATAENIEEIEFDDTNIDLTANLDSPPELEKPLIKMLKKRIRSFSCLFKLKPK